MAERTFPNVGLKGGYDDGEDGWGASININLLKLSVLTQASVIDKVSATPGAPADGDMYIFDATHPTQANKIAVYENAVWTYITPLEGWLVYNKAHDYFEKFNVTWAQLVMGSPGGPTLIERITPAGSNSVTSGTIPSGYKRLRIIAFLCGAGGASANLLVRLNGDTAANYSQQRTGYTNGSTIAQLISQTSMVLNNCVPAATGGSTLEFLCADYQRAAPKSFIVQTANTTGIGSGSQGQATFACNWINNAAIANITFLLASGNFGADSYIDIIGEG